jgi:hypothetical protein
MKFPHSMRNLPYYIEIWILFLTYIALTACATPAQRIDTLATQFKFKRTEITSEKFRHVIYTSANWEARGPLHVYIEGDGRPWLQPNSVSMDPTPEEPMALQLMALDQRPSLYLGRPCYFGFAFTEGCGPLLWTHHRYSETVVASLVQALSRYLEHNLNDSNDRTIRLIGYSGGGVLAMLMAERLKQTTAVVTIAANLDIHMWTQRHQYSKMTGSLNPAQRPPLPKHIKQLHLVGGKDRNVSAKVVARVVRHQPKDNTQLIRYENHDHICCWLQVWPEVINQIANVPHLDTYID